MKHWKSPIALAMALACTLTLAACGGGAESTPAESTPAESVGAESAGEQQNVGAGAVSAAPELTPSQETQQAEASQTQAEQTQTQAEQTQTQAEQTQTAQGGGFWRVAYLYIWAADGTLEMTYHYNYREDGYCESWNCWTPFDGDEIKNEHVEWPVEFEYDEAAGSVTLHYYHFGEETDQRTYDWTPGSHPASNQEAVFVSWFGTWSNNLSSGEHPCVSYIDLYREEDTFTKKVGGEERTISLQRDENGCITRADTCGADGALLGYITVEWEYYSAQ